MLRLSIEAGKQACKQPISKLYANLFIWVLTLCHLKIFMALNPKIPHRRLRESPRFFDGSTQLSSLEDAVNKKTLGQLPDKSQAELEEWKLFGEQTAAEYAEREAKELEDWAADNFPVIGGYTPLELAALEARLMSGAVSRKIKRNGHEAVRPRGSTPDGLFDASRELLIASGEYSPEAREVYGRIKRVLTGRILEDPSKFTAVLRGINGDQSISVAGYLHEIQRRNPTVLKERGLVEDVAGLVNKLMLHYTGNAISEAVQARFSMLFSDIMHYIPGVKHALNVLQGSATFPQNSSYAQVSVQSNGVHEHSQKPPYRNHSRNGWHAVPESGNHKNGKHADVVLFSAAVPKGFEKVVARYNPLPGIM